MKKKDKTLYTEDSIKSLNPREFCRLRPATYLGSNEYSTQLVKEIFYNAVDEWSIGHCTEIDVIIDTSKNEYQITDNGQGFPINVVREDGETVLQAAFDVLNTSGKYDDDGVYSGTSLGLNGIGSKLTNFLSNYLSVASENSRGEYELCVFQDGIFDFRKIGKETEESVPGTSVTWKPDKQFFQNEEADINELRKLFKTVSTLCRGLKITLRVDDKEEEFFSQNGLKDLLDESIADKEILSDRFAIDLKDGDSNIDIAITYTSDYSETIIPYVNLGLTDSGVHIQTVRSAITRAVNKFAEDNGLLKKKESNLTGQELSEGLYVVFNITSKGVKYDSQTKSRVVDLDKEVINKAILGYFYEWLNNPKHKKDGQLIVEKALTARRAREAAQAAKERIRNTTKKGSKFIDLPTKLVDAWSKDRSKCEIYICEGDSAAGGLVAKRIGETQAVFPIRGKILSCRKATPEKVYANQEIANIVKALGLDVDKATGKLIYDSKKLRYGKIVIATDADPDGADIRLLLVNALWWLCPELLTRGHVYAAVPPLFRITTSKNDYVYLKGQRELEDYKKKSKCSYKVGRLKGLGEMDPAELADCILKPDSRHIEQLTVEDYKSADDMLECFMGTDVSARRDYLIKNI